MSGPVAPSSRRRHASALFGSDDELTAIAVPFLSAALDAGDPAVVAVGEPLERLIREAVPRPDDVVFVDGDLRADADPAATIAARRQLMTELVDDGARRIHTLGAPPHPGRGEPWDWWARFEAAANHVFDDFPLSSLCVYDTRITPADVLVDVARTHPWTASRDGRARPNPAFVDPSAFLAGRTVAADPCESTRPALDRVAPGLREARRAVTEVARGTDLDARQVADFTLAVHEVVTNAATHGRPPVRLRVWTGRDRIVAAVSDHGPGPRDPFVGLVRGGWDPDAGGLGLWLAHQLCRHVSFETHADGFTVRLTAGRAHV